jgi:hypothetical protein
MPTSDGWDNTSNPIRQRPGISNNEQRRTRHIQERIEQVFYIFKIIIRKVRGPKTARKRAPESAGVQISTLQCNMKSYGIIRVFWFWSGSLCIHRFSPKFFNNF